MHTSVAKLKYLDTEQKSATRSLLVGDLSCARRSQYGLQTLWNDDHAELSLCSFHAVQLRRSVFATESRCRICSFRAPSKRFESQLRVLYSQGPENQAAITASAAQRSPRSSKPRATKEIADAKPPADATSSQPAELRRKQLSPVPVFWLDKHGLLQGSDSMALRSWSGADFTFAGSRVLAGELI